jgi:hypothetical protein
LAVRRESAPKVRLRISVRDPHQPQFGLIEGTVHTTGVKFEVQLIGGWADQREKMLANIFLLRFIVSDVQTICSYQICNKSQSISAIEDRISLHKLFK